MHYYQFNIGDYRRKTGHLTLLEHGIYRSLLDTYYLSEQPLCTDHAKLMRTHAIRTEDEKMAFENVISDFFTLSDNGYTQKKCDLIIAKYQEKSAKARKSAQVRWGKNANALPTDNESNAKGMLTINHKPLTKNQEKDKKTLSDESDDKVYKSKKGRSLKGKQLETFEQFWKVFNYKKGKADAVDAWLDLKVGEKQFQLIMDGARREAMARPEMIANRKTPKMAQGWLASRRFEDEGSGDTGIKNWWETGPGIEAKGKELGIEQGDDGHAAWYGKIKQAGGAPNE